MVTPERTLKLNQKQLKIAIVCEYKQYLSNSFLLYDECLYLLIFISLFNPSQGTLTFLTGEPGTPCRAQKQKHSLNSFNFSSMVFDGSNQVAEGFIHITI